MISINAIKHIKSQTDNSEGFKYDMRMYVLISSVEPLRVWICREGLVRVCTKRFCKPSEDNVNAESMHLTNYSVKTNFTTNDKSTPWILPVRRLKGEVRPKGDLP